MRLFWTKKNIFSRNVTRRILTFYRFNGPIFAAEVGELGGVDEQAWNESKNGLHQF